MFYDIINYIICIQIIKLDSEKSMDELEIYFGGNTFTSSYFAASFSGKQENNKKVKLNYMINILFY